MTERLPHEDRIIEALRAQWSRVQATAAYRSGALVEARIILTLNGIKIEVSARATRSVDAVEPGAR
jgi:hypothetical protein